MIDFEAVIGLEIHAQLKTTSKIFCGCSTEFGAAPNTHTCPVCLGMPGVLPVLNRKVVDFAIRMGLACQCEIASESRFARKNYFYPDLPKGYQISQYDKPIAEHGYIDIDTERGSKRVGITRIHMEEDAGKLLHDPAAAASRVDLNRTGIPLLEIVSEPDLRSAEEAGAYLRKVHSILRYLDICDGNMEEGSFRCDANVSIRPMGQPEFGTRAEIKNVNSFRFVEKAIQYEITRQKEVLMDGGQVVQETRLWNADTGRTFSMRSKEEAHDYRYFPDPDLVTLEIGEEWIEQIRSGLPELPDAKKARFITQYQLPAYDADLLSASREMAEYFESCVRLGAGPKTASNWIMGPLLSELNRGGKSIAGSPVSPEHMSELIRLIENNTISGKIAKKVFEKMVQSGDTPANIVRSDDLIQVSDSAAIEPLIREVIAKHPNEAEDYRNGKEKVFGFFVGQVMKASHGKANPQMVNELLKKLLAP
jgi:aspartyl-tRNA(Asn)/glutamyl-tRNA(Gln) amidotransferase subunit B